MKTTPATSFWLLLAAVALCALFAWGSATVLLRQAFTQAAAEAGRAVGAMQDGDDRETRETFLLAANRARFLALVPPIAGIGRALLNNAIDPVDGTSLALWRTRLEQISTAWIASTPDVYEARLIGAADGGRELVRVHQDAAGTVSVVAPGDLQRKGDEPYFTEAVRLPAGAVYLSPIESNQDEDRGERAPRPTLRAAVAVRNARGEVFGAAVVNMLAQPLLDAFATLDLPDLQEWVTDAAGQSLWHRRPGTAFARELAAPDTTWQQQFTAAPEAKTVAPVTGLPAATTQATLRASDGADWLMFTRTLREPDNQGAGGLVLHSGIPVAVLEARAWDGVRELLLVVWALVFGVIGLVTVMLLRLRIQSL